MWRTRREISDLRGKMPLPQVWQYTAGQDAPPTSMAARGGARCPAYRYGGALRGTMPRLRVWRRAALQGRVVVMNCRKTSAYRSGNLALTKMASLR